MKELSSLMPRAELRAEAGIRVVLVTLLAALLLNLLPWSIGAQSIVPDFVLLVMLYWGIHAPRVAGLGMAFAIGLLLGAVHGVLLGLHAFTYVVVMFVTLGLRRRLLNFPAMGQALHLAPLILGKEVLLLVMGLLFGLSSPDWWRLAGGSIGALAWWPLCLLLNGLVSRLDRAKRVSVQEG